ncbi:MAG: hypothetical protein ABW019_15975, partial [Chitinophagaceae bacterium]
KEKKEKAEKEKQDKDKSPSAGNNNNSNTGVTDNYKNDQQGRMNQAKANYDAQQSSKALADNLNQGGQDFMASTIFDMDNLLGGSTFLDSHFGLNLTISPLHVANVPLYADISQYISGSQAFGSTGTSAITFYGYCFDAELYLLNNRYGFLKGLGGYRKAYSYLGGAYSQNNNLDEFVYGGEAGLGYDKWKAFAGYQKGSRDVMYSFDDYSNPYGSKTIGGTASYHYTRLSAGVVFHYDDDEKERYIKAAYLQEKPDYTDKAIRGLVLSSRTWLDISVEYFPNYPYAGSAHYTITDKGKPALWCVNIGKAFTLFKGRYNN